MIIDISYGLFTAALVKRCKTQQYTDKNSSLHPRAKVQVYRGVSAMTSSERRRSHFPFVQPSKQRHFESVLPTPSAQAHVVFRRGEVLLPTDWLSSASSAPSRVTGAQLSVSGLKMTTTKNFASRWRTRWKFYTSKSNSMRHLRTDVRNRECWNFVHVWNSAVSFETVVYYEVIVQLPPLCHKRCRPKDTNKARLQEIDKLRFTIKSL